MIEIELIKAIGDIAQAVTVTSILVYWVTAERRARNILSDKLLEDWDDLRRMRLKDVSGD